MATKLEVIRKKVNQANATLAALRRERDDAMLGLLDTPDDADLLAALDQLRAELPAAEGRVAELASLLERAREADTAEARANERSRWQKQHDQTITKARQRVELGTKLDKAIAALGPLLIAWETLGAEIREGAAELARQAMPDITLRERFTPSMLVAASGAEGGFSTALAEQLVRAGVCLTGIQHSVGFELQMRAGGLSIEQASTLAVDRLLQSLRRFEQAADERFGKLAEV